MSAARQLTAGTIYRWVGLPGQYDTESRIRLEHFGSDGKVMVTVLGPDGGMQPDAIALTDLLAAVTLGLLEYHSRP